MMDYENLFTALSRERSSVDIVKLPWDPLVAFKDFMQEAHEEHVKKNAMRLVRELLERREKKIMNAALLYFRHPTVRIDEGKLTSAEQSFFESLITVYEAKRIREPSLWQ